MQDVRQIGVQLVDLVDITGMERQGDHGFDAAQVHIDTAVVVGDVRRIQFAVILRPSVRSEIILCIRVRAPDGGEAGRLCRHDVDAVPVIGVHGTDAGAYKLHDLVLDIAVLKDRTDDRQRDILRADIGRRLSVQIDRDHVGTGHIIGVLEQLLAELSAALADGHGAERTVARVGIRSQDHFSAAGHGLAHVLMDDRDVGRDIDPAVFLCSGQAKHMIILIDRTADCAQGIVAVGQHIGDGEFLHAGGPGGLYDPDKGDVMGRHGIKADLQVLHIPGCVVGLQDRICDRALSRLLRTDTSAGQLTGFCRFRSRYDLCPSDQVDTAFIQFYHK